MLPAVEDFCRLFLVRHPELDVRYAGLAVGAGSAELGRRGRAAVLRWGDLLAAHPIDRVFASDQPQSAEPARAFARMRELEVELEPRLRDQDMGEWQGRAWEDLAREDPVRVREFFESFAEAEPPGGESLGQAVERMLRWWTDLAGELPGRTVVVVGSGSVLSGFAAAMLGMRLSRCISLHLPHGAMGALDVFANGVRLATWHADALEWPCPKC